MKPVHVTINCEFDSEAGVWYVADSDIPGLVAEARTQDEMNALLMRRIPELLALNLGVESPKGKEPHREVPWELCFKKHGTLALDC